MQTLRSLTLFLTVIMLCTSSAFSATLKADFRHRPPEMIVDKQTGELRGPLKDVIEYAAKEVGHDVEWRVVPFIRSLYNLKNNLVDIVPRVIRNQEREQYIQYMGPIAVQNHDVLFIRHHNGAAINQYDDLYSQIIGVKRGTTYYQKFDKDTELKKVFVKDDYHLARLFLAGRIDVAIVLDLPSFLLEAKATGISDFMIATYYHPNEIGNYYGAPKDSQIAKKLHDALATMVEAGIVEKIYNRYGLTTKTVNQWGSVVR